MSNEFFSLLTVTICSIGMFSYIYGKRGLEFRHILFIGYVFRLVLLFADYYDWFPILNSGADTEMFHQVSSTNTQTLAKTHVTGYTYFLTALYTITDCSRIIAQYCNVLFGMGIIFLMQSTMKMLKVERLNFLIATSVLALLPNLNIFSAILLREAWVEFFVALSVYYFVKWFLSGNGLYITLIIASVLAGAYMHAGVIGLLMGYAIAFITYNPSNGKITFSSTTIASLIFMLIIGIAVSAYMDLFTGKFAAYESIDDIVEVTNRDQQGGSDYLLWISVDSVLMSLIFAPLKMFYFLFSPLPTEWRSAKDILGFLIDGAIYMGLAYAIVKYKATESRASLKKYLMTAALVATFIFAYGTSNAGTAFRHRAKVLPLIAVAFAVSKPTKDDFKQDT